MNPNLNDERVLNCIRCFNSGEKVAKAHWNEYLEDFEPMWMDNPEWREMALEWRDPSPTTGYGRMSTEMGFQVLYSEVKRVFF